MEKLRILEIDFSNLSGGGRESVAGVVKGCDIEKGRTTTLTVACCQCMPVRQGLQDRVDRRIAHDLEQCVMRNCVDFVDDGDKISIRIA